MRHFTTALYLVLSSFAFPLLAELIETDYLEESTELLENLTDRDLDLTRCVKCKKIPYPSNTGNITPSPILFSPQVWSFISEPDLHPMKVTVNTYRCGTSSGFIFVAPYALSSQAIYGQTGALILDNKGTPFWFRPLSSPNLMNTDFRVQKYKGKPVLTFWQGTIATPPGYTNVPAGSSEPGSCYHILDNHYRLIKTVIAQRDFISDVHEFLITPYDTALLLSTKVVPMDLTPYGGPQNGFIQDFAIQEIDLHTNKLLFFWDALEHIPLTDSYEPASSATSTGNVWDVFHLNSVGLTDRKDDILVSGRNTWTIYKINKPSGNIVWRLGGKQSSFILESGSTFSWQHDARFLPNNVISLFDDNCCESASIPPGTPPAHGLILQLDLDDMTAHFKKSYYHDPNLQVATQGNVQSLKNGNRFIGWGESQYYSEYKRGGNTIDNPAFNTLYDAQMPGNNISYRTYRHEWIGTPYYPPSIAVRANQGQALVYASWNGSTQTAAWEVFAGCSPNKLSKVKTVEKSGFETAITVHDLGPYFRVVALNGNGRVIGISKLVRLSNP